jgi:hypothetical protein
MPQIIKDIGPPPGDTTALQMTQCGSIEARTKR